MALLRNLNFDPSSKNEVATRRSTRNIEQCVMSIARVKRETLSWRQRIYQPLILYVAEYIAREGKTEMKNKKEKERKMPRGLCNWKKSSLSIHDYIWRNIERAWESCIYMYTKLHKRCITCVSCAQIWRRCWILIPRSLSSRWKILGI